MKKLLSVLAIICLTAAIGSRVVGELNQSNQPSEDTVREFHNAVAAGDRRLCEKMIGEFPGIVTMELPEDELTKRVAPLQTAIENGQAKIVGLLLDKGASLQVGLPGHTPMFRAAILGYPQIIKVLADHGDDINGGTDALDLKDVTPLRAALYCDQLETARQMLLLGARVDIYCAAGMGWNGWVKDRLAQHPDEALLKDNWEYFPITTSIACGSAGTAEILLAHGSDVNFASPIDRGVYLHLAAMRGFGDLMTVLLAHDADVNAKKTTGETPLDYAEKFKQEDAAQLLRDHGGKRGADL